ncbi:hypothetical protein AN958_10303 [Leucoagaricus sp. SymC.cos]|nr:hypothetical protein AN958_10303 [Leucoagaricus sp. SymC.cos]
MDPSYLSPQRPQVNGQSAKRRNSGDYYYVDELGHLHDIDYRPFPPVYPQTSLESKREDEDISPRSPPKRFHTSPNPRPRSPQVPYWETFTFPQHDEPEEVDPFATIGRSCIPPHSSRGIERREYDISYTDRATSYPIDGYATTSRVQADERTGRRVLTKPWNRKASVVERTGIEGGTDIQNEEDEDKGMPSVATAQANGRLGTMPLSPKQKLKRTWVTTRFSMHLKVIRTQQWLKERVQD